MKRFVKWASFFRAPMVQGILGAVCGVLMGTLLGGGGAAFAAGVTEGGGISEFTDAANKAVMLIRFIGVFVIAGGIVMAAINWWSGDPGAKGILWKTGLSGIIIILAPTIMRMIIEALGISVQPGG